MVASFSPPGPGSWALDRSHFPEGATPISQWMMESAMEAGMRRAFAEVGVPADSLQARFVEGFMYTRLRPLIAPDKAAARLPPEFVLRIATRVHPGFRARRRAAGAALANRPWNAVLERWRVELRPTIVATNVRLQNVDVDALDDAALDRHVGELLDHGRDMAELHFWLHGYDLGPIARFLHHAIAAGVPAERAIRALANASPSTSAPLVRLVALRRIIDAAGARPSTLDEVRAVSPEATALLAEHLAERGHRVVTRYDIDGLTLQELPGMLLRSIIDAEVPVVESHESAIADVMATASPAQRAALAELLEDARSVMDMRDDNGPLTCQWPAGLLRRGVLASGARLASAGRASEADHAFELTPDEARVALATGGPGAAELARRASARAAASLLTPPTTLGPAEPPPPLSVLPPPLDEMVAMVQTAIALMGMAGAESADGLTGVGIGSATYRGRVRRASTPEEAIEAMEPGDVLVVRATSPSFNAVLMIAGAVVTADGGALSHAAVLARELGIPAVIGATGALDLADGAIVEVDPVLGCVRVVG